MLYRSYFSKNNTLIEGNSTNNSQNPVTEIAYGTVNADVTRFIFDVDLQPLLDKINSGEIKSDQITRHTLKMVNTVRFSEERLGKTFQDLETQRTNSFELELYNVWEDWDEGSGYEFVYYDDEFPDILAQPSNWFERKTNTNWTYTGSFTGGTGTTGVTGQTILGTQYFTKGNEDIEIDLTDYINQRLFSGDTGYTGTSVITGDTFGLGIKFKDEYESLVTTYRQAVGFHARKTNTFFEPYIETEYDNSITDDREYFYLDKDNELYLYSKVGGNLQDVTINYVEIYDYEDNLMDIISGSSIVNVRTGVNKITVNIDSDIYPDAVLFTDRWNVTQNGKTKNIDQEFYLISQDNYYNFDNNSRVLSDNYYFKYAGIKYGERIKRGGYRRVFINTKQMYKPNQGNNTPLNLEYRIVSTQNDKFEFDVIPWTSVDRTNMGYEFTIDTSWLIPTDYQMEIRMSDGSISYTKERLKFSVISDGITGAQNL